MGFSYRTATAMTPEQKAIELVRYIDNMEAAYEQLAYIWKEARAIVKELDAEKDDNSKGAFAQLLKIKEGASGKLTVEDDEADANHNT